MSDHVIYNFKNSFLYKFLHHIIKRYIGDVPSIDLVWVGFPSITLLGHSRWAWKESMNKKTEQKLGLPWLASLAGSLAIRLLPRNIKRWSDVSKLRETASLVQVFLSFRYRYYIYCPGHSGRPYDNKFANNVILWSEL